MGSETYITNLLLNRICQVNLNYTSLICDDLDSDVNVKDEVQVAATSILTYQSLASNIPAVIACLLMGKWQQHLYLPTNL